MRLFTALELPDEPRKHLARLVEYWKQNLLGELDAAHGISTQPNWVRTENLHVTLKFLGEVADADLSPLCEAMKNIEAPGRIMLSVDHLECLPPRGPVRVIGAGLGGDFARVAQLYTRIDRACTELGVPSETRAFRPHITLARLRKALPPFSGSLFANKAKKFWPGPVFNATSFALIQSELLPGGPRYTPLARFPLDSERSV